MDNVESEVFRIEDEYFDFIGKDHSSVKKFKSIIEKKDIGTLSKNWDDLSRKFRKLELNAGHKGRSLIMGYYLDYAQALKVLNQRLNQ